MTERRQHEEHIAFTMRELSHRTKNVLAVVQGLSHMIARRSEDIEGFETRLHGCLQALAYSHDLLVQHDWQGANARRAAAHSARTFRRARRRPHRRAWARGQPAAAGHAAAGLILHELATNATKHGALSGESGTVTIDWVREPANGVKLEWTECGGPPVTPPGRKGFGQVVFERIGASLEGDIAIDFQPNGFSCSITIAASNLLPGGDVAPAAGLH